MATCGSLGDVHPYIAIGLALKAHGHRPVLALLPDQEAKARAAGLETVAVGWTRAQVESFTKLGPADLAAATMRDVDFFLRRIILPQLADATAAALEAADGVDAVLGSIFGFYGEIVAEKLGIPYLSGILQPTSVTWYRDPPRGQRFDILRHAPVRTLGRGWNKLVIAAMRAAIKQRYGDAINGVRRRLELPPLRRAAFFDDDSLNMRLCLYSDLLGPEAGPSNVRFTGFPVFDSETGKSEDLDPELASFLANGEPPLVFTLGSVAVHAPRAFYTVSLEVARALGRRAVLLTGADGHRFFATSKDYIARSYVPHSLLFPHASAVAHHGGIGTTGQALRAGIPQLIVPHMADQWDNGARLANLGVGEVIEAKNYTPSRAIVVLSKLINDEPYRGRAQAIATRIRAENGAERAAQLIEEAVASDSRSAPLWRR